MLGRLVRVMSFSVVALVALFAHSANANLVVNGDFETGDFTGWTQSGDFTYSSVGGGVYARSGVYGGQFGAVEDIFGSGFGGPVSISQTLSTIAGDGYHISFWLRKDDTMGGTAAFSWEVDGVQQADPLAGESSFEYQQYFADVVATSDATVIRFTFLHDPAYYGLDDIRVVPEPGALWLLAVALAAAGGIRRSRVS